MSVQHHGGEESNIKRFLDQMHGTAEREYPAGRMGADDDGALSYAMAVSDRHRTIIINFGKPVEWIGLGVEDAKQLVENLTERINYLSGVRV